MMVSRSKLLAISGYSSMIKYNCERCKGYWEEVSKLVFLKDVFKEVDGITLHCPSCPTKERVDEKEDSSSTHRV